MSDYYYDRAVRLLSTECAITIISKISNEMGAKGYKVYKVIGPYVLGIGTNSTDHLYVLKVNKNDDKIGARDEHK